MDYALLSGPDYENLPDDDVECFIALEAICSRNQARLMATPGIMSDNRDLIKSQYILTVSAAASQCNIPMLPHAHPTQ